VHFPVMLFRLSRFHAAGEVGEWLESRRGAPNRWLPIEVDELTSAA